MRQAPSKINNLLEPIVIGLGYEWVGTEYLPQGKHSLLRIYIDHQDGINVDDCAKVSHQVSGVLDVEEPIKGHYVLEVSSPGMDRPLFSREQFEQFVGAEVSIRLGMPMDDRRNFKGIIKTVESDEIVVEDSGVEYRLSLDWIESARLVPKI